MFFCFVCWPLSIKLERCKFSFLKMFQRMWSWKQRLHISELFSAHNEHLFRRFQGHYPLEDALRRPRHWCQRKLHSVHNWAIFLHLILLKNENAKWAYPQIFTVYPMWRWWDISYNRLWQWNVHRVSALTGLLELSCNWKSFLGKRGSFQSNCLISYMCWQPPWWDHHR